VTVTPGSSSITVTSPLSVTVVVGGGAGTAIPTGTVQYSGEHADHGNRFADRELYSRHDEQYFV
jgi:hypothetical protein